MIQVFRKPFVWDDPLTGDFFWKYTRTAVAAYTLWGSLCGLLAACAIGIPGLWLLHRFLDFIS